MLVVSVIILCVCVYMCVRVYVYLGYFSDEGAVQERGGERRENQRSRDKIT